MNLLTTEELKDFLRLATTDAAKKMAEKLGVAPIPFGRGRSLGDRFVKEEIEEALMLLRSGKPKSQTEIKTRRRKKTVGLFEGPCPFSKKLTSTSSGNR